MYECLQLDTVSVYKLTSGRLWANLMIKRDRKLEVCTGLRVQSEVYGA